MHSCSTRAAALTCIAALAAIVLAASAAGAWPACTAPIAGAFTDSLPAVIDSSAARSETMAGPDSISPAVPSPLTEKEAPQQRSRRKLVPLRDARQGVATLVGDSWFVITSPTRMHARDALLALGIATTGLVVYAHDQEILDAFQRSRGERFYELALKPGRAIEWVGNMGHTLVYYSGGLLIGYAFHIDPLRELVSEFIESHFVSGGARNIAEVTLGRSRPFENLGPYHFQFQGGSSFPSGHASVIMELAAILSHHAHSRPFSVLAYAAATSVSLARVDGEGHWPSDVFIGAATGHIIATTVVRLHEQRRVARRGETSWRESMQPIGGWLDGAPYLGVTTRF